ncbi:MAG: outer membrane lipoprotein-sorting protein [Flectobacillus sp.]|nr:outer membrane lipoprotein-sorting protein [Flectobacillus sp.]
MKLRKFWAVAFVMVAFSGMSIAQSVDQIVDEHIAAMGGLDKWNALKTVEMNTTFTIQGMEIENKIVIFNKKGLRSEVSVMGQKMVTAIDGNEGWMIRPSMMGGTGEPEDMPNALVKQTQAQTQLGGSLLHAKIQGDTIKLMGTEKLDGADVYKIRIADKKGESYFVYVGKDSHYVLKSTGVRNIQGQNIEIAVTYSDFKTIDGLVFPHNMETPSPMGGGTMTVETQSIVLNPKVDEAILKKGAK